MKGRFFNMENIKNFLMFGSMMIIAVGIGLTINKKVIINARVPSGSMENTIMTGSKMIGLRTAYMFSEPKRWDIVIFKYPDDEQQLFVKRIIGLPREKVTIKDSKIYINDSTKSLEESYLKEEWHWENGSLECGGELVYQVPEDSYFVLGDNRNHSKDSRVWKTTHFVKRNEIMAKAEFVYYPLNQIKIL